MPVTDPREIIDRSKRTVAQIVVVALTVLLNGMDGFDVLSTAFASPGIAREWGIERGALGVVLSKELFGMGVGSMLLGGICGGLGGLYTSSIIEAYGWRSVFYLGTAATALLLPAVCFLVPESVPWLTRKQPTDALNKINAALKKLGHAAVAALPVIHEGDRKKSIGDIFSPALIKTMLMVTAIFFFNTVTFYFLIKWGPQIVAGMGFPDSAAGRVLAMANLGGADLGLPTVGFVTGSGSLLAACVLLFLKLVASQPEVHVGH